MKADQNTYGPEGYGFEEQNPQGEDRLKMVHRTLQGRYHWAILLAVVGLAAGVYGGYSLLKPVYTAVAEIQAKEFRDTAVGVQEQKNIENFITAETKKFRSSDLLEDAVRSAEWDRIQREPNWWDLAEAIAIEYSPKRFNREIFSVSFVDPDPQAAYIGLNAVLDAYEKHYLSSEASSYSSKQGEIQNEISSLNRRIRQIETSIDQITGSLGAEDVLNRYERYQAQLTVIEEELSQARTKLQYMQRQGLSNDNASEINYQQKYETIYQRDPVLRRYAMDRDQLEMELRNMETRYGPQHNQVVLKRQQLATFDQRIRDYVTTFNLDVLLSPQEKSVLGNNDIASLKELIANLEQQKEQTQTQVADYNKKRADITKLQEEWNTLLATRTKFQNNLNNLEIIQRGDSRIEIVRNDRIPQKPSNSGRRKQLAAFGGLLGGCLGFGLVFMLCSMDKRLRDSNDVVSTTGGGELLGVVPTLPDDLADPEQAAIAAHCVHHIRTLLQMGGKSSQRLAEGKKLRTFAMTSPASGTGKTSITLAMGLSFAESGERTLLIDGDMFGGQLSARVNGIARRRLGQILQDQGKVTEEQIDEACLQAATQKKRIGEVLVHMGLIDQKSITEALNVQMETRVGILDAIRTGDLESYAVKTGFPQLSILPVGQAKPHDAGRLSPRAINQLIERARELYDVVLIDTGPVPASLEASVVAAAVDGVVLIVSRGEQRPLAAKARKHLESIGAKVVGVVYNRADRQDVDPYSYRPSSINGETSLAVALPRHATGRSDPRMAGYGPIAKAVSLYGPGEGEGTEPSQTNGKNHNGNGKRHS